MRLEQMMRIIAYVHGDLSQNTTMIDDEQTTKWMTQIIEIDAIIFSNFVRYITQQWNVNFAKTTLQVKYALICVFLSLSLSISIDSFSHLFAWRIDPSQVSKVRIDTACDHFSVYFLEFFDAIGKSQDFRWTHEREVQWIEEKHDIFANVVGER